jgi:hydrogenase nickel incorporation protein HypA/HybF
MHELGIAESILTTVLEAAGGRRVKLIHLQVGKLQHITADSLRFSYDLLAAETCASGIDITIQPVDIGIRCRHCAGESEAEAPPFFCSACGSLDVEILSGEEIVLDRIELEDGTLICRKK